MAELSRDLGTANSTIQPLLPEDSLGYYERAEIDRDIGVINGNFHRALGDGGNPFLFVKSKIETDGHVTVMDAGCGTGYALFDLVEGLQHRYGEGVVSAIAVNSEDFSQQSWYADARRAYRTGRLPYIVGRIGALQIPDDSVDVIYSYEVFQHNEETGGMLVDLTRILSPGGTLLFNTDPTASGNTGLENVISTLRAEGYVIKKGTVERGSQVRDFYSVTKPNKKP